MRLTYKDAGVDKDAGYRSVSLIQDLVKSTYTEGVKSNLGGFSGMFQADFKSYKNPILVSGTDGVGTKVELAFKYNKHNTVGIDAVAMCVNDILCQGARPLFFLDYIATGKLIPEKIHSIVEGITIGCKQSNLALIGGETAEMPGIYEENHYDLAGFVVGIVDEDKIIDSRKIEIGDRLIGLPSSGLHSNGFSLVRKIIFDKMNFNLEDKIDGFNKELGDVLLEPTRIYTDIILDLIDRFDLHAISHITGGGVYENIPRILSKNHEAYLDLREYSEPLIFKKLQEWGNIETKEMYSTFNMGIGMVIVVSSHEYERVCNYLNSIGEEFIELGEIRLGKKEVKICHQ